MSSEQILEIISKILDEMGVIEYEPVVVTSLTDFTYNYVVSVLEEARNVAPDPSNLTAGDISFVGNFRNRVFRDFKEITGCAKVVNKEPLPLPGVLGRYGLHLPPQCLNRTNFCLRRISDFQN